MSLGRLTWRSWRPRLLCDELPPQIKSCFSIRADNFLSFREIGSMVVVETKEAVFFFQQDRLYRFVQVKEKRKRKARTRKTRKNELVSM